MAQRETDTIPAKNVGAYLSWEDAFGERVPPADYVQTFKECSWKEVLVWTSILGAELANASQGGRGDAQAEVRAALTRYPGTSAPGWALLDEYVSANPDRTLAHEQVVYLVAAMAILHGSENGPPPSLQRLAVLLLAGNDYLSEWAETDRRELDDKERLAAQLTHVARFNTYPDPLRSLVRTGLMYSGATPPHGPLADAGAWAEVQRLAFGSTFLEHFHTFVLPLQFATQKWGSKDGGRYAAPVLEPNSWFQDTAVAADAARDFVEGLTVSRTTAQELLQETTNNGIPHAPTLFIRSPFVRIGADKVVAVSPWAVREQLKGGIYAAFARVTNAKYPNGVWPSAFGYLFEEYCRTIARMAAGSDQFIGNVVLSEAPGSADEVEDVVVLEDGGCILASVKARLVREDVARQARSRTAVLDWYDKFLFGRREGDYKPGALRLLDRRVRDIRSGKHLGIPTDCVIGPVLVTFDDLGDNMALSAWISRRCHEEGLLQQQNVLPPVLAHVPEYEALMGLAAKGGCLIDHLRAFTTNRSNYISLNSYLHDVCGGLNLRLPELERMFEEMTEETLRRLSFDKSQ